jgi:ElaB/YqjD/DUF883 family membrane-anchored ribosome-binding protein
MARPDATGADSCRSRGDRGQQESTMFKSGIDQDALIDMFAKSSAQQGEALRKAVSEATLKALQGRALTVANIRNVLKSVTQAASSGAAKNMMPTVEALLEKAFAGMDAALLQAVQAQRAALQQFVSQGVEINNKQMKGALANLEKMEDVFFSTVGKAAESAGSALKGPWEQVLETMKVKGTDTGAQAKMSIDSLMSQAQSALREGRSAGLRNAQALMDSYAALVSGVLIGMSEGLQSGKAAAKPRAK